MCSHFRLSKTNCTMPTWQEMTERDVSEILELRGQGEKLQAIAARVKRSVSTVARVVSGKRSEKIKSRSGRPKKVSEREARLLVRAVTTRSKTASQARASVAVDASVRTVQRILHAHPELSWKKIKRTTMMTKKHQKARVEWALDKESWGPNEWSRVVFSDEKKWNMDGPDGLMFYWHRTGHQERRAVKRHSGGGSVMVWGAFSASGKTELKFISGGQDAQQYTETLGSHLLPFLRARHPDEHVFQHDNAPSHRARLTQAWLSTNGVATMSWPAMSPDLNPIEHLWGILTRTVYAHGRQYSSQESLKTAIYKAWRELDPSILDNLLNSMPKRCKSILEGKGSFITSS